MYERSDLGIKDEPFCSAVAIADTTDDRWSPGSYSRRVVGEASGDPAVDYTIAVGL
jgi:hypothetical protein